MFRTCINRSKGKVHPCTGTEALYRLYGPQGEQRYTQLYSFMTMALEGSEGSALRPGCSLPPKNTRYLLYRRLGGPQDRSGQVRKISPPTGIRSLDCPVRSQSLYRLRNPAHIQKKQSQVNIKVQVSSCGLPYDTNCKYPCKGLLIWVLNDKIQVCVTGRIFYSLIGNQVGVCSKVQRKRKQIVVRP